MPEFLSREERNKKHLSVPPNNERVITKGYTPENLERAYKVNDLTAMLRSLAPSALDSSTPMSEILDLLIEAFDVGKNLFISNTNLPIYPAINPEKIVGETGPDGIVESKTNYTPQVMKATASFVPYLHLIHSLMINLKSSLILSDKDLALSMEKVVLDFFRTGSRLREQISEDIKNRMARGQSSDETQSVKVRAKPFLDTNPVPDTINSVGTPLVTARDIARTQISRYLRQFGTTVVSPSAVEAIKKSQNGGRKRSTSSSVKNRSKRNTSNKPNNSRSNRKNGNRRKR
jgi:hypothetical protein